nr:immunoglobulin light chain junction region [Macaca mulatta]MOV65469.1 immunoglobulin light chain junction region [Macaca mulatta]
CMQHKMLPWTF